MKCLLKKILCYIICGLLTFSVTSSVYYKSVHAMEWVGGALAFEEALKWLLAAIGITATAGMTDAYWDTYGDDFTDYAIENGATQTEVAEWQLKACQGIIDKGSVVWDKFKSWAHNLVNGDVSQGVPNVGASFSDVMAYVNGLNITNWGTNDSYNSYNVYAIFIGTANVGTTYPSYNLYLFTENKSYSANNSSLPSGSHIYCNKISSGRISWSYEVGRTYINSSNGIYYYISKNMSVSSSSNNWEYIEFGSDSTTTPDTNFEASATNVNDLDVISSDGVDEDNPEVTIPMPGVSDSDNEASKDAYQDIIDAINDGTITQEQGVDQIQEILKIVTYDTVTDKVVPPQQNEDGTDKTKDDALKENKENMGFTLGGLEAVFPFCIPFDIYAFMTLLVAEPECPEFDFPIKSVNGQVEEIHIDLEPFEPVAVVVRYCFDFLFIIGLAMLTRSLIGGGSSD